MNLLLCFMFEQVHGVTFIAHSHAIITNDNRHTSYKWSISFLVLSRYMINAN